MPDRTIVKAIQFCRRAGLALALAAPAEPRYLWPEQHPPGVWMVAYRHSESDMVTPYPDELAALRAVNGDDDVRAWFVPWGTSFHDVIWGRGKAATDA